MHDFCVLTSWESPVCCSLRLASWWWYVLLICVLNCQVYMSAHLERPKNERHWSAEPLVQARCVQFCSCLCKVCSRVSEALLLTFQTLSLSFVTNNSSSDSKAFLRFIAFSGSPTAVHHAMQRHGHSYKLISSHALQYCTVGIPFWTYSHRRLSSTEKPQYHIR